MDPELMKDIANEKKFLLVVTANEIGEVKNDSGATSQLACMIKVYNEQLDQLVRMRFDYDFWNRLILAEPSDRGHLDNKMKTVEGLKRKRYLVAVIRDQIVDLMANWKKGSNEGN